MRILNFTYLASFLLCTIFLINCNDLSKTNDASNQTSITGYDLLGDLQVENVVDTLPPHTSSSSYRTSLPNPYTYDNKIYSTNRHFIFQISHFVENVPKKNVNLQINGIRNEVFPI